MLKLGAAVLTIALFAMSGLAQSAPTLRIVADDPNLPADLYYGNIKVKPLRLRPGTNQVITIDDSDFFVSQHYVDFLNRFPDQGGMDYWIAQLGGCGSDPNCMLGRRVGVSAAYFTSTEFQQSGSYIYGFYKASLGRLPQFAEFMPDRRQVVGGANLDAAKATFASNWVGRAEFLQKYPRTMTAAQFVDALLATVKATDGVDLTSQRSTLISQYDGTDSGRASIVRAAVQNTSFVQVEYNAAFVLMQYFGYLRRDPDAGGYQFWLGVMNGLDASAFKGMTCAFITSQEYQLRFGSTATRTNADCGNIH